MEKKDMEIENLSYMQCIEAINILETKKYTIIQQMAKRLLETQNKVKTKPQMKDQIIHDLKGKVNPDYIRTVLKDLDPEFLKEYDTIKKAVSVTNAGQQETDDENQPKEDLTVEQKRERNRLAREEYERSKYYNKIPNNARKEEDKKKESFPVLEVDDSQLSQATRALEEMRADNARLNNENMRLKEEMAENATVAIDQALFRDVIKFATDKNVFRIYLDFDTNMIVKNVRATLN